MDAIKDLEEWYFSQCNEDWEHTYGVEIGTLDNPGWQLKIDLNETNLEGTGYQEYSYGVDDEAETSGNDWLITKVDNHKFVGYGGPQKLDELIRLFLSWARSNA